MVKIQNCGILDFFRIAESKRVFGFGVSKRIAEHDTFRCPNHPLAQAIYKFVDNDRNKWHKFYESDGRKLEIISPEDLLNEITSNDVILIISVHIEEIVKQLDSMEKLNGIDCYLLDSIDWAFDSVFDSKLFNQSKKSEYQIPPIIHYCWFGSNSIPEQYKEYLETWKKYCPNYEIKRWDESNYDVMKHPYMKWAYENKKWAFVSDYARLDIVYNYGGIYLDTDVEILKNLDELRYFSAFMGFESTEIVNSGLGFGAKKGHSFIKKFLENYDSILISGDFKPRPCTLHQTEVLNTVGLQGNNTLQVLGSDEMVILPTECLCGVRLITSIKQITENTFSIHHFAGDWGGKRDLVSEKKWHETNKKLWQRLDLEKINFGMANFPQRYEKA